MKIFKIILFVIIPSTVVFSQCNYQLVWQDEFDGNTLNPNNWSYQLGNNGWGNAELQNYTNSNAQVSNGTLKIIANEPSPNYYESSRIRSLNLKDIKYGKLEASIKLPFGQGIWPAFWMMPSCDIYGGWPSSGEIDIMEYLGHQQNKCYATCHFGNSPTDKSSIGNSYTLASGNFSDDFHLFSIEWSENNIKWFVDNNQILEIDDPDVGNYIYPFNEEFHFILNVAVGGNWPGYPDASTTFPQVMEVEYVKAFQLVEDIVLEGESLLTPNTSNASYSVPFINGATYDWSIPSCATLISGQNTNEIIVNWSTDGGNIEVIVGLPCKTIIRTKEVNLSPNLISNGGFELGKKSWVSNFFNGAYGSFYIDSNNPFIDLKSGCLQVDGLGTDFWNAQLNASIGSVISGQSYYLSFYAKADINDRQIRIDFRDNSNNNSTDHLILQLSNQWQFYEYIYTASSDIADLVIDFNHGYETGTFCYDELIFEIPGTITGVCSSNICNENLTFQNNQIDDGVFHAANNIYAQSIVTNNQIVEFKAGNEINLNSGFESNENCDLTIEITPCISN